MIKKNNIVVFEHQKLKIDEQGFTKQQMEALLKYNELHQNKYFTATYNGIVFNQYVGVIQVQGVTIEIHPKADKRNSEEENGKWKNVLIPMLQACGKLKVSSVDKANLKRQNINLLELYFEKYLQEIDILIHKGLVKQYRKKTENTTALKGKLEFAGHLKRNLIHKERFYNTHQVYDKDHLLHQVLFRALHVVKQCSRISYITNKVKDIEFQFPEVQPKQITAKDLNRVVLTRKTAFYKEAFELAKLIILNYSPDLSGGKTQMISLLFDMNDLWESYVLKQLQRAYGEEYKIEGQKSKKFISSRCLKPDIVIRNEEKVVAVVDTKWKLPSDENASIQDLRQMYTYAKYWDTKKVMLLYPGIQNTSFNKFYEGNIDCKLAYVSALKNGVLNLEIGKDVINQLEI